MTMRWTIAAASLLLLACSPSTEGLAGERGDDGDGQDESGSRETGSAESGDASGDGDSTAGCNVGAHGCPCTGGGGCDPGLACEGGICVPTAGDGDPTTTGDGDPTTTGDGDPTTTGDGDPTTTGDGDPSTGDGDPTTTGDGDPAPDFMCANLNHSNNSYCGVADMNDCLCEGCHNDGQCTYDEDCVCPDCVDESYCKGEGACNYSGYCHPWLEGCDCADCFGHPLCL
jgi:hypothetical protein